MLWQTWSEGHLFLVPTTKWPDLYTSSSRSSIKTSDINKTLKIFFFVSISQYYRQDKQDHHDNIVREKDMCRLQKNIYLFTTRIHFPEIMVFYKGFQFLFKIWYFDWFYCSGKFLKISAWYLFSFGFCSCFWSRSNPL